jgi:hypothetical protein
MAQSDSIELLSVIALVEDMPDEGLVRGQVGTVVEILAPGVFEVEFSNTSGQAYALTPVPVAKLMRLHHEPSHQAA